jgi:hypothetical protein
MPFVDQNSKPGKRYRPFDTGDLVRIQNPVTKSGILLELLWKPAMVTGHFLSRKRMAEKLFATGGTCDSLERLTRFLILKNNVYCFKILQSLKGEMLYYYYFVLKKFCIIIRIFSVG